MATAPQRQKTADLLREEADHMIAQMDLALLPMDERIDMIKIEHGACLPGNLD